MGTSAGSQGTGKDRGAVERTTDLSREAVVEITSELRHLLADMFALYVKTNLQ